MKTRTEAMRDLTENIFLFNCEINKSCLFYCQNKYYILEENSKSLIHLKKDTY